MALPRTPLLSEYSCYNASHIAGCDEAGVGAIVGPIVAAAVILPKGFGNDALYNAKKLTVASRIRLNAIVKQHAVAWSIAVVDHQEIDRIGITSASQLATHKALNQLKRSPNLLLVADSLFSPYKDIPYKCILQGSKVYAAIAAANIIAKVYRDSYMEKLDKDFPAYGWKKNKGYSTPAHKQAIKVFGVTLYHRKSFDF